MSCCGGLPMTGPFRDRIVGIISTTCRSTCEKHSLHIWAFGIQKGCLSRIYMLFFSLLPTMEMAVRIQGA